jgi:phosphatidylglycerophosphatase A
MKHERRPLQALALFFATGFGTGLSPVASGTVGTLPAIPVIWFLWQSPLASWPYQLLFAVCMVLFAVPICSVAERCFQTKDDGRIVADEYMSFPICMIGLPASIPTLSIAFLTFRIFDILKPEPANRLQSIKGGRGIVLDDVMAAIYSLAVNHIVFYFLLK